MVEKDSGIEKMSYSIFNMRSQLNKNFKDFSSSFNSPSAIGQLSIAMTVLVLRLINPNLLFSSFSYAYDSIKFDWDEKKK